MYRPSFSLALAIVLLFVGVLQLVRPFSAAPINPVLIIIAAVLLVARYLALRQRQKRAEILKRVPKHPLGISENGREE
jgi:drug/metabolite transporter (DMT)-like permease